MLLFVRMFVVGEWKYKALDTGMFSSLGYTLQTHCPVDLSQIELILPLLSQSEHLLPKRSKKHAF